MHALFSPRRAVGPFGWAGVPLREPERRHSRRFDDQTRRLISVWRLTDHGVPLTASPHGALLKLLRQHLDDADRPIIPAQCEVQTVVARSEVPMQVVRRQRSWAGEALCQLVTGVLVSGACAAC